MDLSHSFTVPTPVDATWAHFQDLGALAECFPGATIGDYDEQNFSGTVKVKLGPIALVYTGSGTFVEKDDTTHRFVVDAKGKDKRGNGTAGAKVTLSMEDSAGSTDVEVLTDLNVTGKPAQFGRGVMAEVGNKILGRFADCLAGELGSGGATASGGTQLTMGDATVAATPSARAAPSSETAAAAGGIAASMSPGSPAQARPGPTRTPLRPVADGEAIDLLGTAGMPVLRRLAPLVGGAVLLLVVWRLLVRPRG